MRGRIINMGMGKRILSGILMTVMLFCSLPGSVLTERIDVHAAESNVALGKPVEVSGTEPDTTGLTGDRAVDGVNSDNSRWSSGYMKVQTPRGDQWITIDLKAAETEVASIEVAFHLKVWATKYRIETGDGPDGTWETVKSVERAASNDTGVTDRFAASDLTASTLKRYVRFYFTELNANAGGHAVSIREIEIMGTQTGVIDDVSSAAEALAKIPGSVTVSETDDTLPIPSVSDNYDIKVYGSEIDRLVDESEAANGAVSPYRIGDRSFQVILKATNKTNGSDTAKKNITVTVKDNTGKDPALFPDVSQPNPAPDVLPTIQEWYGYNGAFRLTEESRIIVNDRANLGLNETAQEMQADIKEICGIALKIETGAKGSAGNIYLESLTEDTYGMGEEGYFLINGDNGIEIYSAAKTGVLYGTVTVEQILYQDPMHAFVPKGVIRDYPLYRVRGMMFDVARIPTRMQFLQDYTKILKWYKLNEMQLHLNDTQWSEPNNNAADWSKYDTAEAAHRLESELFPSLARQKTKAERGRTLNDNGSVKYQGDYEGRYDYYYNFHTGKKDENGDGAELYYTKEEYRDLQDAAGARGVKLIAELDTPGHATPYNKYVYNNQKEVITSLADHGYLNRDEYLDGNGNVKQGVTFYTHNPTNYEVFSIDDRNGDAETRQNAVNARIFIKALFDEYMGNIEGIDPLFTTDTIHAGVDEYWDRSGNNPAAFRRYMNEMYERLSETDAGEEKEVRMWAGLKLMGGSQDVNRDIVLYMWNCSTEDDPAARLNDGFRLVNTPQPYFYTTPGRYHKDMIREDYLFYNWTPEKFTDSQLAEKGEPLLLGAMAELWGDSNRSGTTEADLNERYLRSAAMMSEKTWGGTKADDTFLSYEQTFDRLREGPGTKIANEIESRSNIVLDYDFENMSHDGKTIYDASGNGYNGIVTGGEIVTKDGEAMLKFDGDTVIETPLTSLGYPYTMSFDLYLDGNENNAKDAALFSGYDGRLQVKGLHDKLGINRNHFTQAFDYAAETGKHRISIVGTHQATKLYVDGEFKQILYAAGRDADNGGSPGNQTWTDKDNNFSTTFVFPLNAIGENFSGCLGNIRAYNKALSTEEFAAEESQQAAEADVARNRFAYADNKNRAYFESGNVNNDTMKLFPAWKATDGDGHVTGASGVSASYESRWYSSNHDQDFLMIDLGRERKISKVVIDWEANRYAASYRIEASSDGTHWTTAKEVTGNASALTTDTFPETTARYVRMQGVQRKSGASVYAIFEMKVYGGVTKTALADKCREVENALKSQGFGFESTGAKRSLFESLVPAKAVCNDVLAGQEEVDAAKAALDRAAYDDASGISKLLYESEALLTDQDDYTAESWNAFYAAYQALKNAGDRVSDAERETLKNALETAKNGLKKTSSGNSETDRKTALAAPAVTSVKSQKTNVAITWNASANASGYQLYRKTGSQTVKVGPVVTTTAAYDEDPVGGQEMSYYVVAVAGGRKGFTDSASGTAKSITLPKSTKKVTASQVKGKRAVNLKWKKVKGAASYLIYRAEGKGSYKKIGQVKKKVTYKDGKKLKKGKTYSYKVVAVVKKQYSPMKAAKKAVKIK